VISEYDWRTLLSSGFAGRVSIGFMHATPGDMKSFKSSAERMALMVSFGGGEVASCEIGNGDRRISIKEGNRTLSNQSSQIWKRL
jgi:hypothetical protein